MLGINCHKLLVNKLLNLPHQETSAASGFSVPVTQPSQTFWSPHPLPPLNLEKIKDLELSCVMY